MAAESFVGKLERVPTGVSGLDKLLQGGLPKGSLILILGPPGSGKSTLARQFLYEGASRNQTSVLVSTSDSQELIRTSMLGLGWDEKIFARIKVVDAYSWRKGGLESLNLKNLTNVSISISEFVGKFERGQQEKEGPYFVIDSFTDFFLNNSAEDAIAFLGKLRSRLQGADFTTLLLLESGIHSDSVVATVEYLVDGTISMKFDDKGRYVMISRMQATPVRVGWSPFVIEKGIDLVVADFFGGGVK